ncbi:transmembrane amino acid transporter protein-domain-containing protein, partial [Dichotomocladium elegans]
ISCVVAGTGTLGIPHALSRSGWIGLVFLLLSSFMAQFCGCILIRCLYYQSATGKRRRHTGFPDIGMATFGRLGHVIGVTFSLLLLLFTPTLYIILAGDNVSRLLAAASIGIGRKACTWIVSAIVGIPFALVRTMRDVSFMSFFASMATVCLLLVVMTVSVSSYSDHAANFVRHDLAIPENIPIAFSTFSFSYCGNVIFPHLESSMAEPESWPKVLLVSTFAVTIMYLLMGFLGYLVYGSKVENPVYNSLPAGSAQNVAMLVATLHVLLAVPMYLYVLTVGIEDWLGLNRNNSLQRLQTYPRTTCILIRTMEISFCAVVAMLTPYFAAFMSLLGTIAADSLTFVLPCVFWVKLSWPRRREFMLEIFVCGCIAVIGTFCAVFGTVDAVHDFLKEIQKHPQRATEVTARYLV